MNNKKGDITIGLIIALAIGVIILMLLTMGITGTWGKLWDQVTNIRGGEVNSNIIIQACSLSCMTGAGYGFCEQKRSLTFEKGKTITGSCNDFATLNPSLGIEKCSTSCTNAAEVEEKKGDEKSGEGYLSKKDILYSLEEGNTEILSEEECEETLEQRRKELDIPDKLCYWEAMIDVYIGRCKNLEERDVLEIFEKKTEYRGLNNPDWPSLKTEGDFCVNVNYNCDPSKWKYRKDTTNAFVLRDDTGRTIYINPYKNFDKAKMQNLLLHEGLHGVQIGEYGNILGGGGLIEQALDGLFEIYPKAKEIYEKRDLLTEKIENLVDNEVDSELERINKYAGEEQYVAKFESFMADSGEVHEYTADLGASTKPLDFRDYDISDENRFYEFLSNNEEYALSISELNDFLLTDFARLSKLIKAYWYTSEILELDPRLSEVHRWWFDQRAPNCEVLYSSERFAIVLEKFLNEKSLPKEYQVTMEELNDVLFIAELKGEREEVWNQLIGRGPGLASTQDINNDEMYA
jgi:hypothetical protein